jgi:murein L,D-transpeptidase YafK
VRKAITIGVFYFLTVLAVHAKESETVLKKLTALRDRVKPRLLRLLKKSGIKYPPKDVFLRVYKLEGTVELFARNSLSAPFTCVTTYTAHNLPKNYYEQPSLAHLDAGPKEQQGDIKVPEGVFKVLYHNPWSSYHLSIALGYPNPADAIRAYKEKIISAKGKNTILQWWRDHGKTINKDLIAGIPSLWSNKEAIPVGNEIFMHGKNVSIGCIPIGDKNIEEVFLLTDPRWVQGTQIHIYPFRFTNKKLSPMRRRYEKAKPWLKDFWQSLAEIDSYFEKTGSLPALYIDKDSGRYHIEYDQKRISY